MKTAMLSMLVSITLIVAAISAAEESAPISDEHILSQIMQNPVELNPKKINLLMALDSRHSLSAGSRGDRNPKRFYLRTWSSPDQEIAWNVSAPKPGRYLVTWILLGPREDTSVRVIGPQNTVTVKIPGIGWQRFEATEPLELPQGTSEINLKRVAAGAPITIKAIELIHADEKKNIEKRIAAFKGDARWMKEAGYGIMVQGGGWAYPPEGDKKPWPGFAEDFDARAFVQKVDEMGGGFLLWSATWAD